MEKSYTKNGINLKNSKGIDFFCPRENIVIMIEYEKKFIEERQEFLKNLEEDLKNISVV
jgi:hypothetical protein